MMANPTISRDGRYRIVGISLARLIRMREFRTDSGSHLGDLDQIGQLRRIGGPEN